MRRMEMLEAAVSRAAAYVSDNAAISNEYYKDLQGMDEKIAVQKLAEEYLEDALHEAERAGLLN